MASIDVKDFADDASPRVDANSGAPPKSQGSSRGSSQAAELVRAILGTILNFIGTLAAIAAVLTAGLWSSRSMIENGSALSTQMSGPWQTWHTSGQSDADPYTRAHLASSGTIRIAADSAGVFEARVDAAGARLHSSCDYILEAPNTGALWWSIAVFDASGDMIENDAGRYTFTSDTIAANPDGSYIVTLGRDARPGNWLPTGGAGRLVLVFTLLDPATGLSTEAREDRARFLPVIRREGCS